LRLGWRRIARRKDSVYKRQNSEVGRRFLAGRASGGPRQAHYTPAQRSGNFFV